MKSKYSDDYIKEYVENLLMHNIHRGIIKAHDPNNEHHVKKAHKHMGKHPKEVVQK